MPAWQSNATLEYPRLFQGLTTLRYSDAVARAGWYNTTRGSTETTPTGPAEVEESTGGKGGGRTQTKECSQMPLGTEVGCLFWLFCSPKRVPRGSIMFLFRERRFYRNRAAAVAGAQMWRVGPIQNWSGERVPSATARKNDDNH